MRQSIFAVAVFTALAAVTIPAAAQSSTSFPWCMKGARGGTSCYFHSYQDCAATVSGLGGWCIRNPYHRGPDRNGGPATTTVAVQRISGTALHRPHRQAVR
jgi:Protein of unknown function (DUF3551)